MSTAVILAGGESRRMGFDKQCLRYGEEQIINHQIDVLSKHFDNIMIISNNNMSDLFSVHPKVTIYPDIIRHCGPLGGIHSALKHSYDDYIFVLACDMPKVDEAYMNFMKEYLTGYDAVVTRYGDWIEPFHGFYRKSLIEEIEKYLLKGRRDISGLLQTRNIYYVPEYKARLYSTDWSLFDNINTKEDLISKIKSKNA